MDKTPPRINVIAFYTLLSVITLVVLKPAFDSYFDKMRTSAVQDRLVRYDDTAAVREMVEGWESTLNCGTAGNEPCPSGARPVTETIEQIASQGRDRIAGIAPRRPDGDPSARDAVRGWSELNGTDPWAERFAAPPEPEVEEPPAEAEGTDGETAGDADAEAASDAEAEDEAAPAAE
jgi:hypothetical protein